MMSNNGYNLAVNPVNDPSQFLVWNGYQYVGDGIAHGYIRLPTTDNGATYGTGPKRRARGARMFLSNRKDWVAATKLGRLVKNGYVSSLEEIFRYNLQITEVEIVDYLAKGQLHEKVLAVFPVVKQTSQGTRTRFKTLVVVGDKRGHVGLGIKCYKEIASAIRGASTNAKLAMIQVVRGKWPTGPGYEYDFDLHTIGGKVSGESGSAKVRLLPAPRGVGIVGTFSQAQSDILEMSGIKDCFITCSSSAEVGPTAFIGNQVKAMVNALRNLNKLKSDNDINMTVNRADVEKISNCSSDDHAEINPAYRGVH